MLQTILHGTESITLVSRFGRSDWLKLGQDLLKREGPSALTLERLTASAGKTRGSFYHHFSSRDVFLEALIENWQASSLTALAERLQNAGSPKAKQAVMRGVALEWDAAFERQLRHLAAQEPLVAELVAKVDELRIQGLASMIRILQPDAEDADALAFVQYASVVGGQMLLKASDDPRIPAIRKAGNKLFGLS